MTTPALEAVGLTQAFGGAEGRRRRFAVTVPAGSLTALIGPNGAGKTTLFNLITNLYRPDAGEVRLFGEPRARMPPIGRCAARGLVRTFQTARVFPGMTAFENVLAGAHLRQRSAPLLRRCCGSAARGARSVISPSRAEALLELVGLAAVPRRRGDRSPDGGAEAAGGDPSADGACRACCCSTSPRPGLNDGETAELATLLRAVRDSGVTLLVVEHNMSLVMGVADQIDRARRRHRDRARHAGRDPAQPSRHRGLYRPDRRNGLMLELRGITTGYGRQPVVHGVSLTLKPGEIVALVGANGAGKSTLVKTISGLLRLHEGEILLEGRRIERLPPRARVLAGIAHVPEGRQVFAGLTVADNLRMGAYSQLGQLSAEALQERLREVCERLPVLLQRLDEPAGNLSGGQQQMLAIARGLMSKPRILLLDEPSLGLSPVLVTEIFRLIEHLREQGLSILLSEQNARLSLAIADRGYVIEKGRLALEGAGRSCWITPRWPSAISASAPRWASSASSASGRWLRD